MGDLWTTAAAVAAVGAAAAGGGGLADDAVVAVGRDKHHPQEVQEGSCAAVHAVDAVAEDHTHCHLHRPHSVALLPLLLVRAPSFSDQETRSHLLAC
jgi:hypothetical protein